MYNTSPDLLKQKYMRLQEVEIAPLWQQIAKQED